MKKIITACIAIVAQLLFATAALAQFSPGQVLTASALNAQFALYLPLTGGTLTGPLTVPSLTVTNGIALTSLATQAANTVVANATGSTAKPTAFTMPSCSSANQALQWTAGSGFTCASSFALTSGTLAQFASTTSAQLAGVLSDETGSGLAVFGTTPTLSQPNIVGVTNGSVAAAGSVGEIISSQVLSSSAVPLSNAVIANVTSISLTAGDWDIFGYIGFKSGSTTSLTNVLGSSSTTSAAFSNAFFSLPGLSPSINTLMNTAIPETTLTISGTTTVFLVAEAQFTTSTCAAYGQIVARRRR